MAQPPLVMFLLVLVCTRAAGANLMPSKLKLPTYRQLGQFLLCAFGALALLLLGFYLYYSRRLNKQLSNLVLFHPPPNRQEDKRLEIAGIVGTHYRIEEPIAGAGRGEKRVMDTILFRANPEKGIVFYSQGVGSSINAMADQYKIATLLNAGFSVFLYDREGYGLSSGTADIDRVMPNLITAYDFLTRDLHYKGDSIIAYGESFGGGVTSELLKIRPLKAIILESTFASPKRWADDQATFTQLYPDFLFIQPAFDNVAMLRGKHPPVLLIVAAKDKAMPASHAEMMVKHAAQPIQSVSLPNSLHAHVDPRDREIFSKALCDFLAKNGNQTSPQ
jgi:pimeloyl-ACP methyl ester carboxylesterase